MKLLPETTLKGAAAVAVPERVTVPEFLTSNERSAQLSMRTGPKSCEVGVMDNAWHTVLFCSLPYASEAPASAANSARTTGRPV